MGISVLIFFEELRIEKKCKLFIRSFASLHWDQAEQSQLQSVHIYHSNHYLDFNYFNTNCTVIYHFLLMLLLVLKANHIRPTYF